MIIRKLRLQHGWSQDQLSQLSGLSTRTIQRIERGKKASVESLKSLAAVFEVNFTDLQQEPKEMNTETINAKENSTNAAITNDEELAISYVRELKGFYTHLIKFILITAFLFIINLMT